MGRQLQRLFLLAIVALAVQRADRRLHQRRGVRYRLVALEGQRLSSDRKELAARATINGYKYWPDAALDP